MKQQLVGKNGTQGGLFMSTVVVHVLRLNFSQCFNQMLKTAGFIFSELHLSSAAVSVDQAGVQVMGDGRLH